MSIIPINKMPAEIGIANKRMLKNVVVASFDILGFKELIRSENGTDLAGHILGHFIQNAYSGGIGYKDTNGKEDGIDFKADKLELYWKIDRFSDSLFIYGNPEESINNQLQNISIMSAKTIAVGYVTGRPYPIRCGIGFGDLVEVTIKTLAGEFTYYTGTAILSAYETECEQKWSGGAVAEVLNGHLDHAAYVRQYAVPTKGPKELTQSINWVDIALDALGSREEVISKINQAFGAQSKMASDVQEKYDNTIKYIEEIIIN